MASRRKARKLLERLRGDRWDGKKIEDWDNDIREEQLREEQMREERRGGRKNRGRVSFRTTSSSEGEDTNSGPVHIGGPINGRRSSE